MWDGILHRNTFRNKCKSGLSRTKTRLEMIKNKRRATEKYLKKDIAELLKNSHDRKACDRVEGLYNDMNLSSCYDYVEQCCACISGNLKEMNKERECPEVCREAVSSLVYAAARFADLPELRDLRNQFNDKYGKSLEPFVSKEFVEKFKPRPPSMEMKLQLMQEIAQEFSMTWDSLLLQQLLHAQNIDNRAKVGSRISESDKMSRSRSTIDQTKSKKDEDTERPKPRRHNSYTEFKDDLSEKLHEIQINPKENTENNPHRKPFSNRIVPAPYIISNENTSENKEENDLNSRNKKDDDLFSKAKSRPKSVRTKFLKHSISSSSEFDETRSAGVPHERRYSIFSDEEDEESFWNTNKPLKTPLSARTLSFPTSPETPKSALPPPPGKRRYLFADESDSCETPSSSSGRSKFLPPEPDSETEIGIRHVHPKMPSFDDLAERVAALRNNT